MAVVEFFGEQFQLVEDGISEFALLEFADAAANGEDGDTMQGMASMYRLVKDCLAPNDWPRFQQTARANRAKVKDLMPVVEKAVEASAERPTGRPSDSSGGPSTTPAVSVWSVGDQVTEMFPGRPDLASGVLRAVGG